MKKYALLIAILAALPVSAAGAEASAFVGQQSYHPGSWSIPSVNWSMSYSNADATIYSLRGGYAFIDTDSIRLNATAAFQPQISTDLTIDVQVGSTFSTMKSSYKHGYSAIGSMLTFKAPISVSLGLDYRFEKVTMEPASNMSGGSGSSQAGGSSNFGRAWARVALGHDFKAATTTPFVGVEGDFALSSTGDVSTANSVDDLAKSLSPKSQIGVYFGVRF